MNWPQKIAKNSKRENVFLLAFFAILCGEYAPSIGSESETPGSSQIPDVRFLPMPRPGSRIPNLRSQIRNQYRFPDLGCRCGRHRFDAGPVRLTPSFLTQARTLLAQDRPPIRASRIAWYLRKLRRSPAVAFGDPLQQTLPLCPNSESRAQFHRGELLRR